MVALSLIQFLTAQPFYGLSLGVLECRQCNRNYLMAKWCVCLLHNLHIYSVFALSHCCRHSCRRLYERRRSMLTCEQYPAPGLVSQVPAHALVCRNSLLALVTLEKKRIIIIVILFLPAAAGEHSWAKLSLSSEFALPRFSNLKLHSALSENGSEHKHRHNL